MKPQVHTDASLKFRIFERYPDFRNVRPLSWSGGYEVPSSKLVGVCVVARLHFDGYLHLPVRDDELRDMAREFLSSRPQDGRHNCPDPDAILVLAVLR